MGDKSIGTNNSTNLITYRQLYHNSSKVPVLHPLRIIAHCDIDAAYAQFEQVRLKIPPEKPLAVQQWRGLIAINYPAREFGITRHLAFDEALKKCPELICVHVATYAQGEGETEAKYHENPKPETHKVSLDPYRRESVKILKIFSESCPTIEKASIDEAFLDLSIPVRQRLLSRYPQLITLDQLRQPASAVTLDDQLPTPPQLDWDQLAVQSGSFIVPCSDRSTSWSDLALVIGAEIMAECRRAVFDQLGYTCSAGISSNKMLAKLCSSYKKPNAQTVLRNSAIKEFLRPLEVSKIRFLGGKLGQSVIDLLPDPVTAAKVTEDQKEGTENSGGDENKVRTVGEVWSLSLNQLQDGLGEEDGSWVWDIVRGIDKSEVEPKTLVKSMMSSKNFRPSISTWGEGIHWLRIFSVDLYARLSEAREVTPELWPKTIVMHKRDSDFNSSAKQIAFPYTSKLTQDYIFSFGQRLLQEFATKGSNSKSFEIGKISNLGLAFHTLERREAGQRGIEGFLKNSNHEKSSLRHKVEGSDVEESPKGQREEEIKEDEGDDDDDDEGKLGSFECERCKKVLRVPGTLEDRECELEKLKIEHSDQHFARDLLKEERMENRAKVKNRRKKISYFFKPLNDQGSSKKP
ncbi:hypothetical protein BY996DRAFT_6434541 [Phakopsora pachyrhizi]|nr:hypothetical protein BY996DRAFT_6434541 [Phakopsora pachyrhizi]